jgi:hypothetical protein
MWAIAVSDMAWTWLNPKDKRLYTLLHHAVFDYLRKI